MLLTPLPLPPPCTPATDPSCTDHGSAFAPPDLFGGAADDALHAVAESFQKAIGSLVKDTLTWWLKTPSPDLASGPAVGLIQTWVMPLTIGVAMIALLVSAGKLMLTRKANPLIDVTGGLALIAATTTMGVAVPDALLKWGDAWCGWVLPLAAGKEFGTRMIGLMTLAGMSPALVVVLGIVVIIVPAVQGILLIFRQAALIILAGLLPLAAAGALTSATRPWFKKIAGWMLALIFYKPCAAMVYATAFTLLGTARGIHAALMGFAMMIISLVAFPVLLKFFTWTTGGADSTGGGSFLGTMIGGATAIGALRNGLGGGSGSGPGGGASAANEHAGYLDQQLGKHKQQGEDHPSGGAPTTTPPPPKAQSVDGEPTGDTDRHAVATDPGAPSGGRLQGETQVPGGRFGGNPQPNEGPNDDPVGPAFVQSAHHEAKRGPETVRWLNEPTGSTGSGDGLDGGGPSGAGGGGGGV